MDERIRLTQYSKAAGCGCKIAPAVLEEILKTETNAPVFSNLLVGNENRDDAAVYAIDAEKAIISTTDFFMPIVDDAFDFGCIAAANAISDVYAMGGKPLMALAILGWPVEKIPAETAKQVLDGARKICLEAGIPLAGGHSIDSQEPIFGLSVNGIVSQKQIKQNRGAQEGDVLFLSKKLGTGILATALKRGKLAEEHYAPLLENMTKLNKEGEQLSGMEEVHAMTDVTGFGLIGHLMEMIQDSELSAEIDYTALPKLEGVDTYMQQFIFPDNTTRNYNAYKDRVEGMDGTEFLLLCDPQTSGGLLVSVDGAFETKFREQFPQFTPIGRIKKGDSKQIMIKHK